MTIQFKVRDRFVDDWILTVKNIPKDIKFWECGSVSKDQGKYVVIHKYSKKLMKSLDTLRSDVYRIGDLIYAEFYDVRPLTDIPTITYQEVFNKYNDYFKNFIVKLLDSSKELISLIKILGLKEYGNFDVCFLGVKYRYLDRSDDCIELQDMTASELFGNPIGGCYSSSSLYTLPVDDTNTKKLFNNRVKELLSLFDITK